MRYFSPSMSGDRKGMFLRIIAITALSAAMFLMFIPLSPAQDPPGPAPFAFTSGDWSVGEVAVGRAPGGGDAVVAWEGKKNASQTYDGLYAQRVDTNGDFLWEGGLTLAEPSGNVNAPIISVNADGSAVAVWRDDRTGFNKLYTQKVDAAGAKKWTSNGVAVANTMGEQSYPSLVSDGLGGAVVVWEDRPNGISHVYAQRIDSSGNHKWGNGGMQVSDAAGGRNQPSLVSDGSGGAVVAWHEENGSDVYGQKFDAAGNRQWGNSGKPLSTASMCQTYPTVVMTPNGDFVTVWNDNRTGDLDIYGQKFDRNGNPVWPKETALARDSNIMFEEPKPVRVQGNGWAASNDVTVFFKGTDLTAPAGQQQNIYGQVLNTSSGNTALKAPVQVLTPGVDDIDSLHTAPKGTYGGFAAWTDNGSGYYRSYYTSMDGSGQLRWEHPQSTGLPANTETQWLDGIASGGKGSALATWVNYKQGSSQGQAYGSWVGDLFPNTYYFAEGTTRPGFAPFIPIMNKSMTDDVAISCDFLKGDGTTQTYETTVPSNSRGTIYVPGILGTGDDVAHDFSVELNSTGPVLAERAMYFDYQGQVKGGTDVIGASSPGSTFYFAEGTTRPGFTSYIAVVNTSDTQTANVTTHFYKGDGTTQDQTLDVPPKTRSTVRVNDVIGEGDDAAHDFSAKVESTNGAPILVERPMYFSYQGQWQGGTDVIGAPSPGTTFYFAEGTTRPGFHSYFAIANTSGSDAEVRIEYYKGDSTTQQQDIAVPANSRQTVRVNDVIGEGNDVSHDFSAKVESTNGVPVLVERPMYFAYQGQWNGGTDVIGASSPGTTFYFAEGTTRPNFDTYFAIQNAGADTADVQINYYKGDGTSQEQSISVPGNSRTTVRVNDVIGSAEDVAHDFSASIVSTNGVPILAERPMYFNFQGQWDGGTDVIGYTP